MTADPPNKHIDFIENSQDLFWQCDAELRLTYVSPAVEAMFGYAPEQMLGRRFSDFQSAVVAQRDALALGDLLQVGTLKGYETVAVGKTGQAVCLMISAKVIRDANGVTLGARGIALDITERKRAENDPVESEERFRKLVEKAPVPVAVIGMDGAIEFVNDRAVSVFGYTSKDIPTIDGWWLQAYPDAVYREQIIADWLNRVRVAIAQEQDIAGNEYTVRCKDGTQKICFISGVPVSGKILVIFDDITERRLAEERLRKSEERYRRLVDMTDTGYVIVDDAGVVFDANREYVRLSGHEQLADIVGRCVVEWTAPEERESNANAVAQCAANGFLRDFEVTYMGRTGQRTPVELNATTLEMEGERRILSLCRDITERKRAERLLSIQHQLAHQLNTTSCTTAWLEVCLDAALSMSGLDCGGVYLLSEAEHCFKLSVHKGLSAAFVAATTYFTAESAHGRLVLAAQSVYSEYALLDLNIDAYQYDESIRALAVIPVAFEGRIIAFLNLGSHLRNDVPLFARTALETIAAQIGTGIARLKTEEALRQSNEKYAKLFKTSPYSITISRLSDGKLLEANQSFTDTSGYELEDVLGRKSSGEMSLWFNPEERHRLVAELVTHGEVTDWESDLRVKNGAVITALLSGRVVEIDGEACIMVIARDISERKRMERALYESEQRYKMVSELATDYVYKLNIGDNGEVTMAFVSDNFYSLTGRTRKDVLTVQSWANFIHPDDLGTIMRVMKELSAAPQSAEVECRSHIHGQQLRWISVVATSEWDDRQHKVTGIVGAVKDITERKNAEARVAAEKERLAVTLRSIGDGVITTDINGHIEILNEVAEELTGWCWRDAQGKPLEVVFNIVEENSRRPCDNPVTKVLSTGGIVELASGTLLVRRDGSERLIADSGAPIKNGKGDTIGVVLVFRDMTEKQKILQTIQRTAKLESLGVLAGGIAHDFNNLLTGIFGYIDLASSTSDNPVTVEYLKATVATMNRARALTLQLLTFAKGGAPVQKVTSLVPFVQETAQFALSGSNVACHFQFSENLWACNIDKNQIGQVIDNIVINAQQAMPNGGHIELEATNVSFGENENPGLVEGNYVKLSIKDIGIGIPKDILPRIFDPFYTTKSKGHGLGLATCYSIISRHGGCIDVVSEPGKGSVFHVYLPATTTVATVKQRNVSRREGNGTIIVVDDEEVIRITMGKMLQSLGYDAVSMRDGREALEFFANETSQGRSLAAIIVDLTIPGGMGGIETAIEFRKIDRRLPLFVASGYADDSVMRNPGEYGFTASLCKPFTIAELSEMLNAYLKN